jgi:hypothetical protein
VPDTSSIVLSLGRLFSDRKPEQNQAITELTVVTNFFERLRKGYRERRILREYDY